MAETKIYGASDDLIELEGQIREEFNHYGGDDDASAILAFSDGTLLEIIYDDDGIWRIKQLAAGTCAFGHRKRLEAEIAGLRAELAALRKS